jgi:magnesium-transporting ATPase (P-type)
VYSVNKTAFINQQLYRNEVETGLTFLGFIVFENKLKTRTIPAITTLRNANIRQIMCTGKGTFILPINHIQTHVLYIYDR